MREGNFLWRNNGDLTFTDVSRETGTFDTGWGWGAQFFDYDNDGWLDLYVINGWVSAGQRELRARHLRDDRQAERRSRRRAQLAADGRTRASAATRRSGCSTTSAGRSSPTRRARHGLDSITRRPRRRRGGFRQRRPARPVRRQRQRRAVPVSQHRSRASRHWVELRAGRRPSRTGERSARRCASPPAAARSCAS